MRGLAEFIMRGRWQALAVTALGAGSLLFGWISAAAVALVTLRKGLSDGTWLTLWALLPAGLIAYMSGDAGSILLLIGTLLLAIVLRVSVSLALSVSMTVVVGYLSGVMLLWLSGDFLHELAEVFDAVLTELEGGFNAQDGSNVALSRPTATQLAGMLAAGNSGITVLSLLLGRYWQALLYNPGGFRREFHALRLPAQWTLGLAVITVVLWFAVPNLNGWAAISAVPLVFCGLALAHARASMTGQGGGWLTAFYVLWLVLDPVKVALLVVVVIDAFIDFRSRWQQRGAGGA
jgi:hypothetical protein